MKVYHMVRNHKYRDVLNHFFASPERVRNAGNPIVSLIVLQTSLRLNYVKYHYITQLQWEIYYFYEPECQWPGYWNSTVKSLGSSWNKMPRIEPKWPQNLVNWLDFDWNNGGNDGDCRTWECGFRWCKLIDESK